jgi:hypothetical protein
MLNAVTNPLFSKTRKHPRIAVSIPARAVYLGTEHASETVNLSEGGMMLAEAGSLEVGNPVRLIFELYGTGFSLRGEVVACAGGRASIRFDHAGPESQHSLRRAIERLMLEQAKQG